MAFVGIDIGALFFKGVRLDASGTLLVSFYERHHGQPAELLDTAFDLLGVTEHDTIGVTGCNAELFAGTLGIPYRDVTLCQLDAIRKFVPDARYIMDIGGGSATLIQLDEHGNFQGYSTNSMCAAGTGSFLDEQAGRLGISYDDAKNFLHNPDPPSIATRCAVFAKSDLIHRQQEGCSRMDMWSGLCRGMTKTLLGTLLHGRPLDGKTAVVGGVALNAEVIRWLETAWPDLISVPANPHLLAACGAALSGRKSESVRLFPTMKAKTDISTLPRFPWPLTMEKSKYPSFATQESYEDSDQNEVRVTRWNVGEPIRGYLGVDIGSTSTKAILIDDAGNVVADIYRKTSGDPIGATKLLFRGLRNLAKGKNSELTILGSGTTGSGRKIVGVVIGADAVVNEISAHVAGATHVDPTIDTIFEIGGQDSKYMHLVDGNIRDSNMNYVCAAGTGSFVEEQAIKLGFKISEAGPAVLGVHPPRATDRCTVFMEQDMSKLVQGGAAPPEAFAAVMVSVVKNYLNKVVGNRYRSREKIFFQGATARNPALVAAFERLLDVEIVVSPYCHVMGSYGVALLTQNLMKTRGLERTSFRGLDLDERGVALRKEECELCNNNCTITYADIDGVPESPSWGYMCGREPGEKKMKVNRHGRLIRRRQKLWQESGRGIEAPKDAPVVGIPQALSIYTYLPLWRRFFNRLGYNVQLSGPTTQEIRDLGNRLSGAEFCFPAKVFLGHSAVLAMKEGVDFIFLPQMKHEVPSEHVTTSSFCPYVQATPSYTRAAFKLNGLDASRILFPIVDLRLPEAKLVRKISAALAKSLHRNRRQIETAWRDAYEVQRKFDQQLREEGLIAIQEALSRGEKYLILVGRPYNIYDNGLNLGLPEKIADQGRTVIPIDFLTLDLSRLGERYRNIYWGYGQKILAALEDVSKNDSSDAIYFTNFSCGPDSFLLSYATEIMGNKPYLTLELDEHGSDTGYMTRIEAFFDVLKRPRKNSVERLESAPPVSNLRDRILWIPNMHPFTTEFFAAALRGNGYDARALPLETEQSFELGRSVTRGAECLPTALTIGSLLTVLRTSATSQRHAFFMPTAQGPCRFGQYITLHRQILDREGYTDVPIMAPSHFKAFQGLEEPVRRALWKGMVAGDILMKAGCKIRPYELRAGDTNYQLEGERAKIAKVIETGGDLAAAIRESIRIVSSIPRERGRKRPLVGIVGEIYVRNNTYANEDVVRSVERLGAEAWMSPLSEWILFTSSMRNVWSHHDARFSKDLGKAYIKWRWMLHWEKKLYEAASPLLDERHEPKLYDILDAAEPYLPESVGGEAILTVGRAVQFARQKAKMVVNVAPFTCMPGTITTAIFREVSADLGMPIVNLFYDGTGGQNRRLEVYLRTSLASGNAELAAPPLELPALNELPVVFDPPERETTEIQA
ncbi:MAG: acyl-CoA dehydratase activase [Pseudomonadota bacterium]